MMLSPVISCNKNPKTYAIKMPAKNEGAEMPITLPIMALVSTHVCCFQAAKVPKAIPAIVANNMASPANNKVPGNDSAIRLLTNFFD